MPRRKRKRVRQSSSPKSSCKYCHKSVLELLECPTCEETFYCSVECRIKDWTYHEKDCKGNASQQKAKEELEQQQQQGSSVDPLTKKEEKCDSCGKSGVKLQKCSQCHEVKYCSKKCQKAEWTKHKVDCKKNPEISIGSASPNSEEKCDSCGKSGVKLLKCSQCREVKYCSKKCQKAEWTKHKVDCKKNLEISIESICRDCSRICEDGSHYCELCSLRKMFLPRQVPRRVHLLTKAIFPQFKVVTNFRDIQEHMFFPFLKIRQVLVVLMCRRGHHFFRPSMNVTDEIGEELCVMFYLDALHKDLSFPWHKFRPGNYMCIPFPQIHLFLDGSIGFRIEDTSDVRIIEHD